MISENQFQIKTDVFMGTVFIWKNMHVYLFAYLLSCVQLCSPLDCSKPGSSVHVISQARILEWVAMPSSRGSSQPSDQIQASRTAGGFFTIWATRKPKNSELGSLSLLQGIFPTQELNQGLLHCRRILYQLSHQGNGVKIQSLETHYQPSKAQPETPGFDLFVTTFLYVIGRTDS